MVTSVSSGLGRLRFFQMSYKRQTEKLSTSAEHVGIHQRKWVHCVLAKMLPERRDW
jgi:hypothetical protein